MLLISLLPCEDEPQTVDQRSTVSYVTDHDPCQHTGGVDLCSPLCVCACCGISIHTVDTIVFSLLQPEIPSVPLSQLTITFPVRFPGAVFHPPKG
jgi:hypothetical protein